MGEMHQGSGGLNSQIISKQTMIIFMFFHKFKGFLVLPGSSDQNNITQDSTASHDYSINQSDLTEVSS